MESIETRYCSLDIETTGFDPAKDEILEIGFAFFTLEAEIDAIEANAGKKTSGFKITQEYSKVFKPIKPVSETILGLTGITTEELENGENFADCREEIQEQLKDVVLVGHNIGFDIKFLQGLGIKFSGATIDTLDLAQAFLPTHPSYNLENLMHYFGVPHTEAHRALADAKATLQVLEGLLKTYANFSEDLKQEIKALIKPFGLPWAAFLESRASPKQSPTIPLKKDSKPRLASINKAEKLELKANTIYNFPLGYDFLPQLAESLKQGKDKSLLVVASEGQIKPVWQLGLAVPAFAPNQLFNAKKFESFRAKQPLTLDELKFVLKILVWEKTNWQTESLIDLNLSFFGGQFKNLVAGKAAKEQKSQRVLITDLTAYMEFMEKGWYQSRQAVFVDLLALEKTLSETLGEKISWGKVVFSLKNVYNPEDHSGNMDLAKTVETALAATDLFFGTVSALVQTDPPSFLQVKFDSAGLPAEKINKIESAAESFLEKLESANLAMKSSDIAFLLDKFRKFFVPLENRVKWLELSPTACTFFSSPVNIQPLMKQILDYHKAIVLCDCLPKDKVLSFFTERLGLQGFSTHTVSVKQQKTRDLFSVLSFEQSKIKLTVEASHTTENVLMDYSAKDNLPAAIILGSSLQVKEFYYKNYERLQKHAFVLAQTTTGGSRILRNFSIHKDTLLLATGKFVLKSLNAPGAGSALGTLPVKTLVLGHLPFEQFTHPYLEAVAKQFKNPFEDFSLPRALLNFHRLIRFFYTPELKNLAVFDAKLNKPYARAFLALLQDLRNA